VDFFTGELLLPTFVFYNGSDETIFYGIALTNGGRDDSLHKRLFALTCAPAGAVTPLQATAELLVGFVTGELLVRDFVSKSIKVFNKAVCAHCAFFIIQY
jgi:hypothetical protein